MKHKFFSVHDVVARSFIPPFTLPNEDMALRTFVDCANDQSHAFGKHPTDYALYMIGEFDDETGEIKPLSPIVNLGLAANFVKPTEI